MSSAGPATASQYAGIERWVTIGALTLSVVYAAMVIAVASPASFYTLDDPYIHMALAENIARGHFGVNLNEVSNPSSSILWPWLLAAFERIGVMLWAPLLVNIACFVASLRVLLPFCLKRLVPNRDVGPALIFCGLGLLAFNLFGVIFTGMEHSLQVFLALVMMTRAIEARYDRILFAALVLSPLVRFEGVILLAFGAGAAVVDRRFVFAAAAVAVAGAIAVAYGLWLTSLGLPMLPSSVLSKSAMSSGIVDGGGPLRGLFDNVGYNLRSAAAPAFAVLMGAMALAAMRRQGRDCWLALGTLAALALAFIAGKLNGYARYEVYALCMGGVAAVHLWSGAILRVMQTRMRAGMLGGGLVVLCLGVGPYVLTTAPLAARNVDRQQHQMHRLATECWKGPVAVNDLGWVSFRNDAYVLDLWGLGSEAARKARAEDAPGWMQTLTDAAGVEVAMIYPDWFEADVPAHWMKVGEIGFDDPAITPYAPVVSVFAVRPQATSIIRACLEEISRSTPAGGWARVTG